MPGRLKRKSTKRYRRSYGKGKGKFSTAHRSKLGKPSRGLQSSRYMFAVRTTETMLSINGGPFPTGQWTNNAGLTMLMHDGQFKLTDLPNNFQYVTLFDAYRINAVKVEFITNANVATTALNDQMMVYNFTDFEGQIQGGAAMPTEAQLLTRQRVRRRQMISNKPLVVYSKLSQLNEISTDATLGTTVHSRMRPKWISTANPTVNHFGLITAFTNQASGVLPTVPLRATYTYYFECRGVK